MAKKLGAQLLNQSEKKYSVIKRVYLDDAKEIYLDIKPYFRPTEVSNVLQELMELSKVATDNNINMKDDVLFLFLDAIAVNHFSNLNLNDKNKLKYIQNLLALIDLDNNGFEKILKSYPAENWTELLQKYFEYQKTLATLIEQANKIKNKNNTTESDESNGASKQSIGSVQGDTKAN